MFLGASKSCESYLLGACLILLMWPVFASEFNCEFLRNDTEGGGGTNPFVDLSILPRFQCSKMRLKAVNHTFQENILPPQCGQYSLQDSIAGF